MTLAIIRKIAVSRNPRVHAAPPGEEGAPADVPFRSLPLDYEMEGHLLEPLRIGGIIRLKRFRRNHVRTDGLFESSEIVAIREDLVETRNSIYRVKMKPLK